MKLSLLITITLPERENSSYHTKRYLSQMAKNVGFVLQLQLKLQLNSRSCGFSSTRKAKAASGHLSFKRGYSQTCHWFQNLQAAIPKLHAKFHQNPWCGFGEKCEQDTDIV